MRVADYVIRKLADLGIEHVFLLPGGGAMHLNDALTLEPRLKGVPCHHEQACGIAAEAYGRTNGPAFGVALVTTGPGGTNVMTPVVGAWAESLPLLIISGQVKRADAERATAFRQSGVQGVDVVAMVKPVTKWARTVMDPAEVPAALEEAIATMKAGRAGPVWLDLPLDVQAAPMPSEYPLSAQTQRPETLVDWENIVSRLQAAERPLFLIGHGVRLAGATAAMRTLAEQAGVPCVTTWNAADTFPYDHPLLVGRPGAVAARAPNFAVQSCDLLIAVGARLDNVVTAYNPANFGRQAHRVVVDVDPVELAKHPFEATLVEADARAFVEGLAARLGPAPDRSAWQARCQAWKADWPARDGREWATEGPFGHYEFVDALSEAVPADTLIVTGSSGLAVEVFYTAFRNKPGQRIFLTSGLGSMGYGLPAAIGACLGAGSGPTLCVESDGSLMLNLQELATLAALKLPITIVVLDNGGYASIRSTQTNYFDSRFLAVDRASGLNVPDLVTVAQALGLPARRLSRGPGWREALAEAVAQPGPAMVVVDLVNAEGLAPKVAAIPQPDGSMISMPLEDMTPLLPLEVLQAQLDGPLAPQSLKARGG